MKKDSTKTDVGSRYLLVDNDSKYLGVLEVVKEKVVLIDDLCDDDIDYKIEGYKTLAACKKDLKKIYSEYYNVNADEIELVIKKVKVIRKFK